MKTGSATEPGVYRHSLDLLTKLAKESSVNGIELSCSLIFDEMAIRKHLQWSDSRKQFLGFINYGFRPDCVEMPVANNAIVFMVNGINLEVNLPVAHYFINTLCADEKIALMTTVVNEIRKCGVRVLSITFDGLSYQFFDVRNSWCVF